MALNPELRKGLESHLAVEDIDRLDAVLDHPDGPVEGAHDVRGRLSVG